MNTRIYIKKQAGFDVKTDSLQHELNHLGIAAKVKVYTTYDIFNATQDDLNKIIPSVFTDPVIEVCLFEMPPHDEWIAVEYLPGQFDLRADAAMQCCQLLLGHNQIVVQASQLIGLDQTSFNDRTAVKDYLINVVDSREKDLTILEMPTVLDPLPVIVLDGFTEWDELALQKCLNDHRLAINLDDLLCIQHYFKSENRNPTITEIKVLDTYWSDHCRHTTFFTHLNHIRFEGEYQKELEKTFYSYQSIKKEMGKENTPVTLMELGTILPKYFLSKNRLSRYYRSKENNAATIEVDVDVHGVIKKWLLLFKNETHNHPTEIEPKGGAATCIGGAIRDPLSGRAFVYQAMRLSGAGDPLEPISHTLPFKLPQQKISREAAIGYSSYGNQIGLATSLVSEIFHEGYKAKRFECGFVIAAVNKDTVIEQVPVVGDVVLLIGGDTGRDGIGGASGSSMQHTENSKETMQSEVQKGNAITERKIQRLFKRKEVAKIIKKCNDFGAGGVCVAIGEIADSVEINLNNIPLKYEGLNGTDLALSESQERMAVVVRPEDVSAFLYFAAEENVKATHIATVTDDDALSMKWNDAEIVSLKRSFLQTNGAIRKNEVTCVVNGLYENQLKSFGKESFFHLLASKEVASQKGMVEHFDSTVLGNTCLMPFGGIYQLSPSDVSAHFICDETYTTNTVSMASWGYHPSFTSANQYLGGMYAIIESLSKLVAAGANYADCYLTFQEYFERLGNDPLKWGKPFAALLGAFEAQLQLGVVAIGGKDSMSGSFKDIHVPPTFVSFAVCTQKSEHIISTAFQSAGHFIYLFELPTDEKSIPLWDDVKSAWNTIHEGILSKKIVASKSCKDGGIACTIAQMCFGNKIGAEVQTNINLLQLKLGNIVIESTAELSHPFTLIGKTVATTQVQFNGIKICLDEAIDVWSGTFESLFPTTNILSNCSIPTFQVPSQTIKNIGFGKPTLFLPVFPGTNCEFETANAFEKEGASVNSFVFNNLNKDRLSDSILKFTEQVAQSQIIVFSGGFSGGDEPDGSAKYIVNILKNSRIQDSVHQFLDRGGLILGICNGFQALIKSGLLPYGVIKEVNPSSPTLTYNSIGRHISQMVNVRVINDNSPWLQGMKDMTYTLPVSHGEGRFYASETTLQTLINDRQIATQYVDQHNMATHIFPHNPNGSVFAIEGLISKDGKIFGRMSHPERMKPGRFKNIPTATYQNIFKNGVDYFL